MKFVFVALVALACVAMGAPIPVHMNTDNIHSKTADLQMMKDIKSYLDNHGYTCTIGGIGPNYHYSELSKIPQNGYYLVIVGGACAGSLYEMYHYTQFKNALKEKNARMVIAFLSPPSANITGLKWLPRAHDDNFSPAWFKGIDYPEKHLRDAGFGVDIAPSALELAQQFPNIHPYVGPGNDDVVEEAPANAAIPVFINTDNIYSKSKDLQMMKDIKTHLDKRGYSVTIGGIGPNYHYSQLENVKKNGYYMPIFGGACAGTLYEMYHYDHFKNVLKERNAKMVIAFLSPPSTNITGLKWLPRAHDDNFSPAWFKGIDYPEKHLREAGFGVDIGKSAKQIADQFPNIHKP